MTQASIVLLLKMDKDPLSYESYKPLSLLNADVKVLAKILVLFLEDVMLWVVSGDQNGFIKGHQLSSNLCMLFDIIYLKPSSDESEMMISMDA